MHLSGVVRWGFVWVLLASVSLDAAPPVLHLRTGSVSTVVPGVHARASHAPHQSGLFLIQLEGPLDPAWRDALEPMGVALLRYVPEDGYVARFKRVDMAALELLPFVRWVGDYASAHKLDPVLRAAAQGVAPREMAVSVILANDLAAADLAAARGLLQRLDQEAPTRFGTILRGTIPSTRLEALGRSEAVLWAEPMSPMRLFDEVASKIVGGDGGPGQTTTQSLGLDGSGVTVAVADSGLHNGDAETMHPDLFGRVVDFFWYGSLTDASDGHSHGTHVAGIIAGNGAVGETDEEGALYGLGIAPGVQLVAQRLFDDVGGYHPPPTFELMTRDATRAGAEIGSNSWGDDSNGRYDSFAAEFDALVRDADASMPGDQPYILEFSAGNAGPGSQTIGTPAVAKNVIATGAAQNNRFDLFIYDEGEDAMADFSSRGPAEDGRIKPDLTAPGTWIASLQSASATDENAWLPISGYYQYQGGTSQAGPLVSGAAAVFVQYYRGLNGGLTPSPALVKAALINSATDMDDSFGTDPIPNHDEGWGRVDLPVLVDGERPHDFLDQSELVETGQTHERRVVVATEEMPLKITLAYTDVPGFPGAIPALVNNLDLEVVAPDGRVYRGNQFDQGESVPNAPAYDSLNNVEGVHLSTPLPGEYLVRVTARNVAEDARIDTPEVDQDFALVVSGDLPLPGVSLVFFNRRAYRAPDQIDLRVIDLDQAGQPSLTVQVLSDTESSAETVILSAVAASGVFAGSIATGIGTAAPDGVLQVSHDDTLTVAYVDISSGLIRTAAARVDLIPPQLGNVSSYSELGRSYVTWDSDEPASSTVHYTEQALQTSQSVTDLRLTSSHEISLRNLIPGATYLYYVVSADEAGNVSTNDNNGLEYSLVAPVPPAVLLVDDYTDFFFEVPPLSGYTDALDAIGVDYDVWDATSIGHPTLEDLQPYRAVMWRVSELVDVSPMPPATQATLRNYLDGGGSLFIASTDLLSWLDYYSTSGVSDFRVQFLHVQDFEVDATVPEIQGVIGESTTMGVDMELDYAPYDDPFKEYLGYPVDASDTIVPTEDATPILFEPNSGEPAGLRFPRVGEDSPGRLVFLSFPLDTVPMTGPAPNNRVDLLRNLLGFLIPLEGSAVLVLDRTAYTIPSQVTVELTDLDLVGAGTAQVHFTATSDPVGKTVTLQETVRPGLFRGYLTLVSTNTAAPGLIKAASGDTVLGTYLDLSTGGNITVEAIVETDPPVISLVSSETGFQEAVIRWHTSEPTDALVQFGESAFLNRTAYRRALSTEHELTLTGLQPEKTYYFQVVSRDIAGNVDLDDNGGSLHALTTLTPLMPPWTDTLEAGAGNWTVLDGEDSEVSWELGVPQNGHGVLAHSPANAWGSNLNGDNIGYAESFLISPPIYLEGGTSAQLRYWQNYDYPELESDIIEFGEILIITNVALDPITLGYTEGASFGWEEAQFDLTPYMGQLVYVVFHYVVLSFENYPRLGWLIDDVSVTVSGTPGGTIEVANNLGQATWSLAGPISRSGQGLLSVVNSAPPGNYTVTFGAVPFWETPSAQAGSLASQGLLQFSGQYVFIDQNTNNIPDPYEEDTFGEVDPDRTDQTDTDGDGATDQEEYAAGTDPNDSMSNLVMATPVVVGDGTVQLQWATSASRIYRVVGSADGMTWLPASDWMNGTGGVMAYTLPPPGPGQPLLFQIEVRP